MQISKITVKNFRSIREAEIIPDKFNIFVGQNNHGKTNFFEAIDWFYGTKGDLNKIRFGRTGDEEVSVEIEFSEIQDGIEKMKNEKNKTVIKNLLSQYDKVRVKRTSLDNGKTRKIFNETNQKWLEKNPMGFDSASNDFFPKFEYVSTKISPMEVAKYGKNTPIANMLSGVLAAILEQDQNYVDFKAQFEKLFTVSDSQVRIQLDELSGQVKLYLEKQFPDCYKVVFEVLPPIFEDLLKRFDTSIDDGVYTSADEKGDGMQRALMLAIIQVYADFRRKHEDTSKFFLFFIDEGELHLHPTAQRKLKNALLDLAKGGDQVFINTHSSVLVSDDNDNQTIFRVEKIDRATSINPITKEEKPYIVYDLLGGSPADLLLPKNFLIVEGTSELEFLTRVISRFYTNKPEIQIIQASGDLKQAERSINAIEQVFKPLEKSLYKDKVIILFDQPNNPAALTQFFTNHPGLQSNKQAFQLTVGNIEEYYPNWNDWRKTSTQVDGMSSHAKVTLARQVGDGITQQQFEQDMQIAFDALQKCWALAYD